MEELSSLENKVYARKFLSFNSLEKIHLYFEWFLGKHQWLQQSQPHYRFFCWQRRKKSLLQALNWQTFHSNWNSFICAEFKDSFCTLYFSVYSWPLKSKERILLLRLVIQNFVTIGGKKQHVFWDISFRSNRFTSIQVKRTAKGQKCWVDVCNYSMSGSGIWNPLSRQRFQDIGVSMLKKRLQRGRKRA